MYKKARKLIKIRQRITIALFLREAKSRFGNNKLALVWAILEPAFQVLVFSLIFIALGRQTPHGSDLFTFFIPGVITYHIFSKTFSKCMDAISANKTLLSYPIMKPFDVILARALVEFLTYIVILFTFLYLLLYLGLIEKIYRLEYFITPIIFASLMGLGLGTLIAAISSTFPPITKIVGMTNRALFLSSGIFFSVSMLPQFARDILLFNPILHLNEMMRYSLIESFPNNYFNMHYVLLWSFISFTVGLGALHYAEKNPNADIRGVS